MLAPTVDSDKTEARGRRPRCGDEAARSGLGVEAPQAMKSAIAAGHHGVPFSLKYDTISDTEEDVVWSKVGEEGAPRQTKDKTSNGLHTFFSVPGLRYPFLL